MATRRQRKTRPRRAGAGLGTEEFLTIKGAAAVLDTTRGIVRQLVRDGRLPAVVLGPRLTRIHRAALTELARPIRRDEVKTTA